MRERCEFGRTVQIELAKRDWSAQQLADKIGCTRQAINYIVTGERRMSKLRKKICEVLEIEMEA